MIQEGHRNFLTHAHDDHAGFLNELMNKYPDIKVIVNPASIPVLRKGQNGFNVDAGVVVVNEADKTGKKIRKQPEIDFVCSKGSKRCYIQSLLALPSDEKKQEQRPRRMQIKGQSSCL